jgi:hypothetical protein
MRGARIMKTKLAAVLTGIAILGSVAVADAADVTTPANTQVVVLTDTQMDKVTAGHLYDPPAHDKLHWGSFWKITIGVPTEISITYGPHAKCGSLPCAPKTKKILKKL